MSFRIAPFSADITIPLNHRCMGLLPTKSKEIIDPLQAHGFVLLGGDKPIVQLALDWCEVRNEAYERWRHVLAEAAGTDPARVLLSSLHQHDAPVTDIGAQNLLDKVGLPGELFDFKFHEECVQRVAATMKDAIKESRVVTHYGVGQAKVEKVASNRRVVIDGAVSYGRGSSSGGNKAYAEADDGLIDPFLKTLSIWDGDNPIVALHAYSTHPMSFYGRGGVTYDFVGIARELRRRDDPQVQQIYVSGCSGDTTAGKYNDGSAANRQALAHRLYDAMKRAWEVTQKHSLESVRFQSAPLTLPYRKADSLTRAAMTSVLEDSQADVIKRIYAAMSLNSWLRVKSGKPIDVPCFDLGQAQLVLLPGEAFVGYQLLAQSIRPDSIVVTIGYGECWPGYIPTDAADEDHFTDQWLWVDRGCEPRIRAALEKVLK
ncbi:MAG TPA: hypothetical protein VK137_01360 [Planctomycetaceae bacterium]|nr:hypothetical protein [Planctomycetaceae bacterium]